MSGPLSSSGSLHRHAARTPTNTAGVRRSQPGRDIAWALTPDGAGGVMVAGMTSGSLGGRNAGSFDAFLARFSVSDPCLRDPDWLCDGDVDGDGQVNPVDSGLVQAAFGSADESDLCQYDVDCDGQINPVDSGIVQSLFGTCEAPREVCP